jgi:hypothetical protein
MSEQLYTGESGTELEKITEKAEPQKEKKSAKKADTSAAALSKFQKFSVTQVHRSSIQNAPYNPRTISEKAKKKLRDNLKRVGLIEPIIWNKTTGNIVGGHQRIASLDALERSDDYLLDVAQVEMDEKTEKEQNVFLNNGEAQGDWDLERLESLYRKDKIDYENTGFDMGHIYQLFGSNPLEESSVEELEKAAEKLREAYDMMEKTSHKAVGNEEDDVDFFSVIIFKNFEERIKFHAALDLTVSKYIDGKFLTAMLGQSGEGPDIAEDHLE